MECDLNGLSTFTVTKENTKMEYPITQTILFCCPNWKKQIEDEKNIVIENVENISIDGISDFFEGLIKNGKIYITKDNCHTIHYLAEKCGNNKIVDSAKKVILENSSTPYPERLSNMIQEDEKNNHKLDRSIEEEDIAKHYNELLNYPDILKNTPIAQHCRIVDIALNYYKDQFNYRKFISFVLDLLENENDRKYNALLKSFQLNDFDSTEIDRLCKCKNFDENFLHHKVSNINSKILKCEEKITKQEEASKMQFEQISNTLLNLEKLVEDFKKQSKEQISNIYSEIIDSLNEIKQQNKKTSDDNYSKITQLLSNQQDSLNEIKQQNKKTSDDNYSKITQLLSNQQDSLNEIKKQNKETSDDHYPKITQLLSNQQDSLNEIKKQNQQINDEINQQNRKNIEEKIESLKNEIKYQINNYKPNIDQEMITFIVETIKDNLNNVNNIPRCPGCNAPVIKDGGCNHMTCSNCKQQFCNLCGSKWEGHSADSDECKKKQEFTIFIKKLDGKTIKIETRSGEKTDELRAKVINKINDKASNYRLMYAGKQIENGMTVGDYGICRYATIHILLVLPGG